MSDTDSTYSPGDYERVGIIKKAADCAYEYVSWLIEDHSRSLVEKEHKKMVDKVIDSVMDVLGLQPHRSHLAGYFIANILQTAREEEEAGTRIKGWTNLSDETLSGMYNKTQVAFSMGELKPWERCMYAGVFMSDRTSVHDNLAAISAGELVGSDPIFVTTSQWRVLLEVAEIEGEDFEHVGHALLQLAPIGNTIGDYAALLEEANKK